MPRSVRDSDEDVEVKIGRRTRAGAGSAVPESPIRRSSRNKQSTKQNDSSPDLSITETNNTQTSRSFRSRAGTVDSNSLEIQRRLRSSKNIADMNETKDSETSAETQPKKITRRSIAAMNTIETPKANTRVRRLTRAGSETKTTPTGRVTRKTRASSMDLESTADIPIKERHDSQIIDTPSRTKRRASVFPSQSTVVEEKEKEISYIELEKPLIEEDESVMYVSSRSVEPSDQMLTSLKNESNENNKIIDKAVEEKDNSAAKEPVGDTSHNDHRKIHENVINEESINKEKTSISDQNNVLGKDNDNTNDMEVTLTTDEICNISRDSLHSVETTSEKIELKDKSILHVSLEEGEINTSDKENECLNTNNSISKQNKNESILNVSLEEGEINTSNKENECLNIDGSISEQNKNTSNTKKLNLEITINALDTSAKEDKNDQCNDNTKLGNVCLMKCSVAVLNCDNLLQKSKANNGIQDDKSRKEKNGVSILDIKGDDAETSNDKNNMDNIAVMGNPDVLNTVSNKILIAEGTTPKLQSLLNDCSNTQIQGTIREEKDNLETVDQSTNNTKERNCEVEPKVNVSVISNNTLNVSVNSKEDPMDISMKEDNCTENIEATEIQNVNNDINESTTPKDSYKKQGDIPPTNENQHNMSTSTHNSSSSHIKQDDIPSINENQDNMSTSMHNSSSSHRKQDDVPSTNENQDSMSTSTHNSSSLHIKQDDIPSTNENQDNMSTSTHNSPTMVLQISDNSNEEPAHNTKQIELHSSECLIDLQSSQPRNSIHETNDSSTVAESHDGPEEDLLDEEGPKIKTSSETPKISKRKSVTELNISKTEKEAQKDHVQNADESDNISSVGMLFQDISADEWKQKRQVSNTEGENNSIHSTSTVKLENDSETECDLVLVDKEAWLAAENLKTIKDKETFDYDSDDTIVLKSKMDYLNDKISNSNQMKILSKDPIQENDNVDSSKLLSKKTQGTLNEKTDIDECDVNVSLQNTSKKEKSLNKSKEDVSNKNMSSKSDSMKLSDKQLEEEIELTLSKKESEDHNKSKDKLRSPTLERKDKKNRSLNNSLSKKNKSKEGPKKYNRLHISSSDEEDEAKNLEDNKGKLKGSEKKRDNKNYSTMVHIGSDSDTCDNSSNSSKSDTKNKSLRIPCFLFKHKNSGDESGESDEFNEDRSSKESIDSDIDLEYNLGGKTIGKFSDDDIPGDECRASESESSDPDDNGSDLADFVVDDDEVDEEDEEDEGENENENEGEDEDEDDDDDDDEEEDEEKDEELDQEMKDVNVTEDKNVKKDKDVLSSEEKEKDNSNKHLNVSNIKNDKKKNQLQKTSLETHSAESAIDEIVADNKVNTSTKLDSSLSEKKKKKKQKLHEYNETIEETPRSHLNESELMLAKNTKVANVSLTCSTPKTDFHKHEQFKHNISSEKKKRRYIEKTSVNEESENISLKDISTDNFDNNKTTLNNSINAKKKHSVEKNISADSLELIKDINFPKSLLSKKAHLNKTMSPSNETPTTKYLKKQKLNDSAPFIKLTETKRTSENISLSDNTTGITKKDGTTPVISEKTADMLKLDSSFSAKKKKSLEASADLDDQTELKHKKLIFETGQISEVDDKAELQTTSDNEKENSKRTLKVDGGKQKKKKKTKKNRSFQELDIVDMKTKMVEDVDNDKKVEVICNIENQKNKKKNKNKKSIESEDKCNDKPSSNARNYEKCIEAEDIPNKKKKKVKLEIASLQAKQHSKKSLGWEVSKSSTSFNVEFSDGAYENVDFLKSKHEALQAAKRAAESIKANKHMKKKMHTDHVGKIQQKKEIGRLQIEPAITATSKRGIKRLSIDVIENLSDIPMRPHKKQRLAQKPAEEISHTIIKNGFTESGIKKVNKHCIPSNSGGTTEFDVVNLKKAKKQLNKKIPAIATFRQKMLSRNSRYPVTSYIMYLQKQKALAGDQGFVKQF